MYLKRKRTLFLCSVISKILSLMSKLKGRHFLSYLGCIVNIELDGMLLFS